jgi:hypothetical protein
VAGARSELARRRRAAFAVLLFLTACGGRGRPSEARSGAAVDLASLRFAEYNQPSAFHGDFWSHLDLAALNADLALLQADGFNGLAVPIPFGAFVRRVDADGFSTDAGALQRLGLLLDAAQRRGLVTVLWVNEHRLPAGVGGTRVAATTDPAGVRHAAFDGYYADGLAVGFGGDSRWRAFLGFCAAVADVAAGRAVVWDALDWQYTVVHPFQLADPEVVAAWRGHLRSLDPDARAWQRRWGEPAAGWEDVLPPASASDLAAIDRHAASAEAIATASRAERTRSAYAGHPATPVDSAKWSDYRAWRADTERRLHREIVAVLRAHGAAPIGLRVDVGHGAGRDAWAAAADEVGADLLMLPATLPVADPGALRAEVAALTATTARPVVLWETVIEPGDRRQAAWSEARELARDLDVGIGLWAWRDSYFDYYTDRDHGLRSVVGVLKEDRPRAHLLDDWGADGWRRARIEPTDRRFATPTGGPAFVGDLWCGLERIPVLYTVAPSTLTFPLAADGRPTTLEVDVLHPLAVGDGVTARVTSGDRELLRTHLDARAPGAACPWRALRLGLPAGAATVNLGTEVAGDESGDWLAWRDPRLVSD